MAQELDLMKSYNNVLGYWTGGTRILMACFALILHFLTASTSWAVEGSAIYKTPNGDHETANYDLRWGQFLQRSKNPQDFLKRLGTLTFVGKVEFFGKENVICTFDVDGLNFKTFDTYSQGTKSRVRTLRFDTSCRNLPGYAISLGFSETRLNVEIEHPNGYWGGRPSPSRMHVYLPPEREIWIEIRRLQEGEIPISIGILPLLLK